MISLITKLFEGLFSILIFSPGLRGIGIIYYALIFISLLFCIPLLSRTYKFFFRSKISSLLALFYLITGIGLLPSFSEFQLGDILIAIARITLYFIFIFFVNGMSIEQGPERIIKYYLLTCLIAASFIYIQYFTGPLNIFSEEFSVRAGLPRYSTLSGSTNMFSISIAFSILISTFTFRKIDFLNSKISLFIYQFFLLGAAIANLSRSGLVASIVAFGFSRIYFYLIDIDPNFFENLSKFRYKFKIFRTKIKLITLSFYSFLLIIFISQFNLFSRYLRTVLFFFTGNKQLISIYSDATFENSRGVFADLLKRLNWFDPEFFGSLVDRPLNLIFGGGSKYFGGTIGLPRGYSHNMFMDIFQAQGLIGLSIFIFIIFILFLKSVDSKYKIIKFNFDIRSLSIITLFFVLTTHNSGLLFHTLSIYPLIFIQDFLKHNSRNLQN